MPGILHALFSLRAEGCPRLAFDLLEQEQLQQGRSGFVTVLDPTDDLRLDFERLGIPVQQLHSHRWNYVAIYQQFLQVLKKWKPAGVVLYPIGAHLPMALACQRLGIPHVVHVACLPPWRDTKALNKIRAQFWAGLPITNAYAACSERVRMDAIKAYRLPPKRVQTIYNGISFDRFGTARASRMPWTSQLTKPLVIGMTGSLELSKDHPMLLRAVAHLHQLGHPVKLRLVGGGSQRQLLEQLATQLGIASLVEWTGAVRDVISELKTFDVFCFSAKPEEGLGIALIEALAAGLPAVATDIPAVREIFRHYPEGVVVPFGNSERMAEGILAAASRPGATLEKLSPFDVRATFQSYSQLLARQSRCK